MTRTMIALAGLSLALPAAAQTAPAAAPARAPAIDPARLAAARSLIDQIMPPATREQMMQGMMMPMIANIRQGLAQNPQFAQAMNDDPRVRTIFDQFMDRQMGRTLETLKTGLPGMVAAMSNAYARRFDLAQLHDISAFFATPTGRAYMQQAMTIMSDPDIAAWQRSLMTQSMTKVQDDMADLVKQIDALPPKAAKP